MKKFDWQNFWLCTEVFLQEILPYIVLVLFMLAATGCMIALTYCALKGIRL